MKNILSKLALLSVTIGVAHVACAQDTSPGSQLSSREREVYKAAVYNVQRSQMPQEESCECSGNDGNTPSSGLPPAFEKAITEKENKERW